MTIATGGVMSVSGIGGGFFLPTAGVGSAAGSEFLAERSVRDEVRDKGGLVEWAKETKLEALKRKIEEEVLKNHGVNQDQLSAMSEQQQAELKSTIAGEVARRLEEAVKDAVEKETKEATAKGEAPKPMFVDILV